MTNVHREKTRARLRLEGEEVLNEFFVIVI